MAHRTCGIVYYANDLTVITKTGERVDIGRTEVMLVRENDQLEAGATTTKEWIAVVPVDRNDSADEVTDLEWLKTATETERTAVRFVRVDASPHELRLMQARPPTWGDTPGSLAYRSFPVRDIPLTILKSQDPTLRRLPPIAAQLDALRSASKTPPVPEDPAVTQQLLEVVSGLAADVQALKTERTPPAGAPTEKDLFHRQLEALGIKLPQQPPALAEQVPVTLGGADEIERLVAQRVEEELRKRQSPPAARDGSANLFASSGTGSANQQLFANLSERLGGPARAATGVPPSPPVMPENPLGNLNPTQKALLVQLLQNISPTQQAHLLELLQTVNATQQAPLLQLLQGLPRNIPDTTGALTLDMLAGNTESGGSATIAPGARGLASLDRVRAAFRKDPKARYEHVRAKIRGFLREKGKGETAIEAYFETFVEFNDDLTAYFVTLFAEIITALERSDTDRALGVACSGIQFLEQRALDGQALDLAWLCTLLEDPIIKPKKPAASSKGRAKGEATGGAGRLGFARTIEHDVLTAVCAALKDWDALDKLRASSA